MSQVDSMGLKDPILPIISPFLFYRGFGFPFLAWNWVISCHLPLGFPFSATNCVFHCHAFAGCLIGLLDLFAFCVVNLSHRFFHQFFVVGCYVFRSTNLIDKNGSRKLPFSASNFDNSRRLFRHPLCLFNLQVLSLFRMVFHHHLTFRGCVLKVANLIAKNGNRNLPFLPSNCVIRCVIWFHFCFACGLCFFLDRGFYHICNHLSVDCGGSIPPSEFWSWISSTLTLDGFHCPLHLMKWVSLRNLSLFTCHGVDLPSELLYVFARKFSAISCMALHGLQSVNVGLPTPLTRILYIYPTLALIRPSRFLLVTLWHFLCLEFCYLFGCTLCTMEPLSAQPLPLQLQLFYSSYLVTWVSQRARQIQLSSGSLVHLL